MRCRKPRLGLDGTGGPSRFQAGLNPDQIKKIEGPTTRLSLPDWRTDRLGGSSQTVNPTAVSDHRSSFAYRDSLSYRASRAA